MTRRYPHVSRARLPLAHPPVPDPRRWIALAVFLVAFFMTLLDASIVNVALRSIGVGLGARPAELQWVVSGYTLAFGMVPIVAGRLGDDLGRRRMFTVGTVAFTLVSAVVGLSWSPHMIIAARVLQGAAGGLIAPQVSGLIQQLFRGTERARAFGWLGTVVGLSTATGPLVGGALIELGGPVYGWRIVFFVNVPIGVAAVLLARRLVPGPASPPVPALPPVAQEPATRTRPARRFTPGARLDLPGVALLAAATLGVLLPTIQYDANRDLRLFLLMIPAAGLVVAFVRRERRLTDAHRHPLIDLRLFRARSFSIGATLGLFYFCAYPGVMLVLALYYQQGLHFSPLHAGMGVTAFAVGNALAARLGGRLVGRLGRRLTVLGIAMTTTGAGLVAVLSTVVTDNAGAAVVLILAGPLMLAGCGSGLVITPNQTVSLEQVPPSMGSTAGGVLQTGQRIGSAVGLAVAGTVFFAATSDITGATSTAGQQAEYSGALRMAMLAVVGFSALALVVAIADVMISGPGQHRRPRAGLRRGAARPEAGPAAVTVEELMAVEPVAEPELVAEPEPEVVAEAVAEVVAEAEPADGCELVVEAVGRDAEPVVTTPTGGNG